MRLRYLFILFLLTANHLYAQTQITIGAGSSSGNSSNGATGDPGPIYRSSASSSFDYSRHHYLYTASELAAAGLTPGAIITDLAWYKTNNTASNGNFHFEIWMENSSLTSVPSPPQTWSNLTNGAAVQVYNSTTQTMSSTIGFWNINLSSSFTYTGGALQISVAHASNMISGSPFTNGISWKKDNATNRTISYVNSTSGTTLNNLRTVRPQLRITFNSCTSISNLTSSNVSHNYADVSWDAIPGTLGYEYVFNQSSTPPSGAGTPTNATALSFPGLSNGTDYYIHVRNQCATSFSAWETHGFQTIGCFKPTNMLISNITDTAASVLWSQMPGADSYDYAVNFSNQPPATFTNTTSFHHQLSDLVPNSKYYVHVRSRCFNNTDNSQWRIDSFVTLMACYPPNVQVNDLGTNKPYAYWDDVPTAHSYEYELNRSETPPAFGGVLYAPNVQLSLPDDGTNQYLHVRTKCNSMFTHSAWTSMQLRQGSATAIGNSTAADGISIYPNPVKDVLHISGGGSANFSVTNMAGGIVMSGVFKDNDNGEINLSQLPAGMYILKLEANGRHDIRRFAKQ
jgi:hypothetical protein